MANEAIQTLETAARILMAPPSIVTAAQRQQAESVFIEFRSTKNPYQLCREILEKSNEDFLLFEAARLLKTAIIREWSLLSESDILSLRTYLLQYLLGKNAPGFLREKILQTIAIITKRGSNDDGGLERRQLLTELENLVMNGPHSQQRLACSLIQSILQEYAVTVKSADVGLIWEVHFRLKKQFEAVDLKRIFRFAVGGLEQFVRSGIPPEREQAALVKQLLTIVESILCWGQVSPLLPKRLIGAFEAVYESDSAPALRLSASWRDTILQPELVSLFFDLHVFVRHNPELAHPSLTCLVQLASMSGAVVSDRSAKLQYLHNYVTRFLQLAARIEPAGREMLGFAEMSRKLVLFFPPALVAALPDNLPAALLQQLTSMTCHCIRGSVVEEDINDDTVWRESLGKLLETWSLLLQDCDVFGSDALSGSAVELFNTYLQCRLAPPDGTRSSEKSEEDAIQDGEQGDEGDERRQHAVALQTLGALARRAPHHVAPLLATLLHDRSNQLENQLQMLHMGEQVTDSRRLVTIFDDLHWLIMITGHFLCADCEDLKVLMPSELVRYSAMSNSSVDASLRYLVGDNTSQIENVDTIIRLVAAVLRLSDAEVASFEKCGNVFSPELSATISWLMRNWAKSYLMPHLGDYQQQSEVLEAAWGASSQGVAWAAGKLLWRVRCCLRHSRSEPAARTEALRLLLMLASIKDREGRVARCEHTLALVRWDLEEVSLDGETRRFLHRAFVTAAANVQGDDRTNVLSSTSSLYERLMLLVNNQEDSGIVRTAIANTLDCYIGVAEGVQVSMMEEIFSLVVPALEQVSTIIDRYHNYPAVVLPALSLLAECSKKMLVFLNAQDTTRFYVVCLASIEVYARWNSGRIARLPQDAEEDTYQDLMVMIELLTGVLSKEALDLSDGGGAGGAGAAPSAVCARAMRLLVPLISSQLLAMPALATAFYRMLRDMDPSQVCSLPADEFNTVMNALRVGLTAVSADVATFCCDCIAGLANHARTLGDQHPAVSELLPLAELLLALVIKKEMPPDSTPATGTALYSLNCIRPTLLENLARELIKVLGESDPANVQRFEHAFVELVTDISFDGHRQHKLKFRDNFDKFLVYVHGFLLIK